MKENTLEQLHIRLGMTILYSAPSYVMTVEGARQSSRQLRDNGRSTALGGYGLELTFFQLNDRHSPG